MDIGTITTLATVPAVLALVTLAKDLGLPARFSPLLAVVLGVAVSVFEWMASGPAVDSPTLLATIGLGIILGLSASGLYDGAKAVGNGKARAAREDSHPTLL